MRGRYTLAWLDSLITVSLNPEKSDIESMTDEQINSFIQRIGKEKDKQQAILKQHIFGSTKEKQIELLLKQYHSSLVILLDQALENHKYFPEQRPGLKQLTNELIQCLDELLSFIEVRYSSYLSLKERVPITYLKTVKIEFRKRLESIKPRLIQNSNNYLGQIILEHFNLLNHQSAEFPITFQEIFYKKDLLYELEKLQPEDLGAYREEDLNALLVYMNFNCKSYANYISQRVAESTRRCDSLSARMDSLLIHQKEFNQMRRKPGVALNSQLLDLKTEVNNWFDQEIAYLQKKIEFSSNQVAEARAAYLPPIESKEAVRKIPHKLLCDLSVDQLALILKAADDSKLVISRSLSMVFKSIVPFLSTPHQKDISFDSMRSKSYVAEDRDKHIAIKALDKMIAKIREY